MFYFWLRAKHLYDKCTVNDIFMQYYASVCNIKEEERLTPNHCFYLHFKRFTESQWSDIL